MIDVLGVLKFIKEFYMIIVFFLTIVSGIITSIFSWLKHRKNKTLKKEGIRDIEKKIGKLKREKLKRQFNVLNEYTSTLCTTMEKEYIKFFKIDSNTPKYFFIKYFVREIREKVERLFKIIIYNNNLTEKNKKEWEAYKIRKLDWIYSKVSELGAQLYSEKIMNIKYTDIPQKFIMYEASIVTPHIIQILEDIRKISKKYDEDIENNQELLNNMVYR